jgi:nucleotide-binding universal stress UspA family protein
MTGRIVVGVDGSEGSLAALRWAAAEAILRGDVLHVVTVWELPHTAYMSSPAMMPPADLSEELDDRAHEIESAAVSEVLGGRDDVPLEA